MKRTILDKKKKDPKSIRSKKIMKDRV